MKPEAQRIAIAEAQGKKPVLMNAGLRATWMELTNEDLGEWCEIPNYPNDKNVMLETTWSLRSKPETVKQFMKILHLILRKERGLSYVDWHLLDYALLHASAAQLAEAYLKTIGKWVEE